MSDVLHINFAALAQASADISKALNDMESQLSQAESDAAPLISTWEGDAQTAYQERQRKWRAAANDLATMLRDIKSAVDDSAANFQHTEKKNADLFR